MNTITAFSCPLLLCCGLAGQVFGWSKALYDKDGDGYAVWNVDRSLRADLPAAQAVTKRGDYDDNDPDIHPRQREVYGNGIDDDCDGRVDEPVIRYAPSGVGTTTDGFTLEIEAGDSRVGDAYLSPMYTLQCRIEIQDLGDTASTTVLVRQVSAMDVYPSFARTEIAVDGLPSCRVHRARVSFSKRSIFSRIGLSTPIGDESDWYYTTTDGTSSISRARTRIVLRALYERYLSEHAGSTGYLGAVYADGTRYEADRDEAWCSEFYAWCAHFDACAMSYLLDIGDLGTNSMKSFFADHAEIVYSPAATSSFKRGDYLALDTTGDGASNHSAMVLAVDSATGMLWTVEGNTDVEEPNNGSWSWRLGGNEAGVQERDPAQVVAWGLIRSVVD